MAMSKKKRMALGVGVGVLAMLGIVGVAAASGGDGSKDDGDDEGDADGKGDDYKGPGPNLPDGKKKPDGKKPSGPSIQRPEQLAPGDLWIAPDCSDVVMGEDWLQETAIPAIESWRADGVPMRDPLGGMSVDPSLSPERVVREIIGPYAPLCADVWPWRDIMETENTAPLPEDFPDTDMGYLEYLGAHEEWGNQITGAQQDALDQNPAYGELVAVVYAAVRDAFVEGEGANA